MARHFTRAQNEYLFSATTPITAAPFTVSVWVKTATDTSVDDFCIVQIQDASAVGDLWRLNANGNLVAGEFTFGARDTGNALVSAVSSVVPNIGTWYNVVGVERAADDREVFVDGGNSGVNAVSRTPNNIDSIAIGMERDSSADDPWDGDIAEVALWNTDLSDAEIAILAAGYSPLFVHPQNLVAYWSLIRDEDQDRVGGYDMTAFNTPTIATHAPVIYPSKISLSTTTAVAIVAGKLINSIRLKTLVHGSLTG